jgi:hypothetical protein
MFRELAALAAWTVALSTTFGGTGSLSTALEFPKPGDYELKVLAPDVLELTLITTKDPDPARPRWFDFANDKGKPHLPPARDFTVSAGGRPLAVKLVGFKRRVLYAPLQKRDLRIANYLYLQLAAPVPENETVEVRDSHGKFWPANCHFQAVADPFRSSPVIHVNEAGYVPAAPKKAMLGYYLGSLGELPLGDKANAFFLINAADNKVAFEGKLPRRPDSGFTFPCYQQVFEADFSAFNRQGEYRLRVPSLGVSYPFRIDDGVAATLARTDALGLYHQRCGMANALPYTRFAHGPCHTNAAEVPTAAFEMTQKLMAQSSADYTNNRRHTAPQLKDMSSSLYPFVRKGKIDVSGGHHDAGDYSKYTINSAGLIHYLVTAADAFAGAGDLDNLGLPESGDGKSDLLEEAKWEADFLSKMQDEDGGFYFLVYPRDRRYENDVTPDKGDRQVVWPKTTAVTAAAVAALAQCGSSPRFKKEFPQAATGYVSQAKKGWEFLERAIAAHGKDGAYQKITHYGDEFMHDDELAWAACELFLATGDLKYHRKLTQWFDPTDSNTRRWGWLRLCAHYGDAIRSYALAPVSGRMKRQQLDLSFLARCENELIAAARDQLKRSRESAYGTSFPSETKRFRNAGWYFSSDPAFDMAVACQLEHPEKNDLRPQFIDAIWANLNYELGCNPVNAMYITGLGWKRQREIVHQYAQNDRRVLPPSGIPIGNIQAGFMWLDHYKQELGALSFPLDGVPQPYPFYDRWGDSYNLSTEFVILNQGQNLGVTAWLMAQTPLKSQNWKPTSVAQIEVHSHAAALRSKLDLSDAQIVWEAEGLEPAFGPEFHWPDRISRPAWIEAEALLPDGRRVFAVSDSR